MRITYCAVTPFTVPPPVPWTHVQEDEIPNCQSRASEPKCSGNVLENVGFDFPRQVSLSQRSQSTWSESERGSRRRWPTGNHCPCLTEPNHLCRVRTDSVLPTEEGKHEHHYERAATPLGLIHAQEEPHRAFRCAPSAPPLQSDLGLGHNPALTEWPPTLRTRNPLRINRASQSRNWVQEMEASRGRPQRLFYKDTTLISYQ